MQFPPALLGASWAPKIVKNRTSSESKFETIFKSGKSCSPRASWGRLGPILGHFGRHLGPAQSPGTSVNVVFGEN